MRAQRNGTRIKKKTQPNNGSQLSAVVLREQLHQGHLCAASAEGAVVLHSSSAETGECHCAGGKANPCPCWRRGVAVSPELRALLSSTGGFPGHLEVTTGASGATVTCLRPQPSRQKLLPVAGQQTFCWNGNEVHQMPIGFFSPLIDFNK